MAARRPGITVGMSLMTTISRLAASPRGRRLARQAMDYARSPEGKRKIEQARRQLAQRRKPKSR
jgi:hypothetical protein